MATELGFEFAAVTNLTIQRVTFLGCGQTRDDIEGLNGLLEPTRVVLVLKSVVHVSLVQMSIKQFTGIGLYGYELKDAFLNEVEFSGCNNCSGAAFNRAQSQTSVESILFVDSCKFTDLVYCQSSKTMTSTYISAGLTLWKQRAAVTNSLFSNNSAQFGSAIIGIDSDCQLTNTTIVSNLNSGSEHLIIPFVIDSSVFIGGQRPFSNTTINILESVFRSNVGGAIAVYSIAGTVAITRCLFYNNSAKYGSAMSAINSVTITVSQTRFYNNLADIGGALAFFAVSRATIRNSSFASNDALQFGGAVYVTNLERIDVIGSEFNNNSAGASGGGIVAHDSIDSTLAINNCTFTGNSAILGGAIFKFQMNTSNSENGVIVTESNFSSNGAFVGAAIYAGSFDDIYSLQTFSLSLSGVIVRYSRCDKCNTNPDKDIQGAAIYVNQVNNVDVNESEFYGNSPNGAIEIRGGKLHFYGTIKFEGNRGSEGGAISLLQNSKLYFHENCYVMFIENVATRLGGAIYIDGDSLVSRESSSLSRLNMGSTTYSYSHCSIQFVGNNAKTLFSNNTAQEAGNSVYATPIYDCWLQQSYSPPSLDDYMRLFGIRERNEIASFPVTVELGPCEQGTNGNYSSDGRLNITSYPGKAIRFRARALDLANVSSPSLVYATVSSDPQTYAHLDGQEYVKWVNTKDPILEYHVYGQENAEFNLLLSTSHDNVASIVHVALLSCGLGFFYRADNNLCQCSKLYQNERVSCNIADGTLSRTTQWLGMYKDRSALVRTCPFMYCRENVKDNLTSDDLRNDVICSGNRVGPLCGKCKEGFSLGFGSSNCVDYCTNTWLASILLYAAMGAILVIILFILNLTVTQGTLYGLIFYANVVIVNRDVLLSTSVQRVAAVFYFITLDLGFIGQPLCFLASMDQATKTGLQFFFPVYLVLIVCAVYLICKYCCSYTTGIEHGSMKACSRLNTISQFIGGRVTSVIATLLYLSYSSLLRTVIEILSPANNRIEFDGNETPIMVWLYDGSIRYAYDKQHIGLIAAAVIFLIILLLYTGILTLMPLADLFSGHSKFLLCISSEFNRHLKPFADACYSPFRGKWRVWLGLRLCVLVILYGITASFGSDKPTLIFWLHTLIMATLISFQAYIRPLCKPCTNDDDGWVYNCLDLFYQLDYLMIVLCAWYYYQCETNNTSKDYVTTLLLCLAMIAFVLTVLHHVIFRTHHKTATKFSSMLNKISGSTKPATFIDLPMKPINQCELGNELREPVME